MNDETIELIKTSFVPIDERYTLQEPSVKYTYNDAVKIFEQFKHGMLDGENKIRGFSTLLDFQVAILIISDMANKIQDLEEKINTLTTLGTTTGDKTVVTN